MAHTVPDLSFVVPVYNAGEVLVELCRQLVAVASDLDKTYEIILVNDSSKDNSWQVIQQLKLQYGNNLKGIHLAKNFGQQGATFCGIVQAQGEVLITIDDDLEQDPADIKKMLLLIEMQGYDLVYARCERREYSLFRRVLTYFFVFLQKLKGDQSGNGASFRAVKKDLYVNVKNIVHGFAFADEVFRWHTDNIHTIFVKYNNSQKANSSYHLASLLSLAVDLILFSSNIPLRLITVIGLLSSFLSFSVATYFLAKKLFHNINMPGYASLIVSIFLVGGIIMFSLGIIGEYINKIYVIQKKVPSYAIRKII